MFLVWTALSETRPLSIQLSNHARNSLSVVTWTYGLPAESPVKSDKLMSLVTLSPYKLSFYSASPSFHDTNFLPVWSGLPSCGSRRPMRTPTLHQDRLSGSPQKVIRTHACLYKLRTCAVDPSSLNINLQNCDCS